MQAMRSLLDSGLSAAEAARVAKLQTLPSSRGGVLHGRGRTAGFQEALERFDEAEANAVLDEAVSALSVDALASQVILRR